MKTNDMDNLNIESLNVGSKLLFQNKILWNIEDLIQFTGLKKQTIYNLTSKRKIPFRRRCSRLFFIPDEILNWIQEGENNE